MEVQEFFPPPLAGFDQQRRGGKLDHEFPGKWAGPVLKGLQSRRIVFQQGLLELIDQGGALFDENDFVPAQQAQLLGQRIHRVKGFPPLAIHAQGIGEAPAIEMIRLGPAGSFALAIAFRGHRVDRVDQIVALQELIDNRSLTGFDGHCQVGPGSGLLLKTFPSGQRMIEFEISDDLPVVIDDDHGVMIASPIQAGEVGEVFPVFHALIFAYTHRGAVVRRPDTGSLAGYCSLRRWDGRRQPGR